MDKEDKLEDLFGEQPYRMLVKEIKDFAIFHLDLEGRVLSWNEGAEIVFGYAAEEMLGQQFSIIFTPEDRKSGVPEHELEKAGRVGLAEDVRWYLRKNGSRFYASGITTARRDEAGTLLGFAKVARDATARKLAEDNLVESEIFSRRVFDSSTDCIKVLDLDGKLLSINAASRRAMEIDEFSDLEKRFWTDFWDGEEREQALAAIETAKQGGTHHFRGSRRTAKGNLKYWDVIISPIFDAAGNPKQLLTVSRDITVQKQIEEELRMSNQRTRTILESITDAFFALNHDWQFTYINQQAEELLQRKRDEILGKSVWEEFPHAVSSIFYEQYHRAVASQTAVAFESFYAPLDTWFEVRAYPSPDGLSVYFHDITARKQSEAMLLERSRLATLNGDIGTALIQGEDLQTVLGNCTEALVRHLDAAFARIWTLNEQENVLELQASSGTYTHLDGAHSRVPVGKFKIGMIAEERLPHLTNDVAGDLRVSDKEWAKREGMTAFAGYPLIVEERLVGVMCVFARQSLTDVTLQAMASVSNGIANSIERKRIEEERKRLLTVAQRAQRTAEENNKIKDEFLANLSHELRTPLSAILGWSNLLRSGRLDAEATVRAMETVERNALSQVQLIDDLLDISRIITGKLRLEVRPVELPAVIEAAVDVVRPAAKAKNIRLQTLLDTATGAISGDADRLQQVVWNLLTNAVKFTPKDGRVQIRLERVNSHVELIVSDTGKGIAPEFLPSVFDRFRQADQTSTRRQGGLGLGLSIARQIVEMHGGTVQVESEGEGKGASFVVKLPLSITVPHTEINSEGRVHPTASKELVSLDCAPELKDLRVLVVDDEEDSREMLRQILEHCGSIVTAAGSAADALAAIEKQTPDVLISDIGMPDEDGYSLIAKIRSLSKEKGGRIPAIALTAYARVEDRVRALRAGFQVHVPKPVEPVELAAVVASVAGRTERV
jgi:PAS domain S-box-containing protein